MDDYSRNNPSEPKTLSRMFNQSKGTSRFELGNKTKYKTQQEVERDRYFKQMKENLKTSEVFKDFKFS